MATYPDEQPVKVDDVVLAQAEGQRPVTGVVARVFGRGQLNVKVTHAASRFEPLGRGGKVRATDEDHQVALVTTWFNSDDLRLLWREGVHVG